MQIIYIAYEGGMGGRYYVINERDKYSIKVVWETTNCIKRTLNNGFAW